MRKATTITIPAGNAPAVAYYTASMLRKAFERQVLDDPLPSQRSHMEENEMGRAHVQTSDVESPHVVINVARYVGAGRRQSKYALRVLDGYHRLAHWFMCGFPSKFSHYVVLIHDVHLAASVSYDDMLDLTDKLACMFDNKKAAKRNASRWCAAVRTAFKATELAKPVSKAYTMGTNASSFFKRALKSADAPISSLVNLATEQVNTHKMMDELYAVVEKEMRSEYAKRFFHPGVMFSIFNAALTLTAAERRVLQNEVFDVISSLGRATAVTSRKMALTSPRAKALFAKLKELDATKDIYTLGVNREGFYNRIIDVLAPVFAKPKAARKTRLKAV